MNYEFDLNKPLPSRARAEAAIKPTTEQVALAHWLKAQMLRLLLGYLDETDRNTILASAAPFHLFELSNELCTVIGLESGCVVLLELVDVQPKLIWSDEDLALLERVPVDSLRAMCCALSYFITRPRSFLSLTA